jgi:hypothetical protein
MISLTRSRQKGQAIVMVTLALIAMCGMLGLAVDLGWSFFIRRSGQSFADAGALAAAVEAFRLGGASATVYCGVNNIVCNTPNTYPCPGSIGTPAVNLDNGCLYARGDVVTGGGYTGFLNGSNSGRTQTANIESGSGQLTLSDGSQINTFYWARSRVSENIPQLFSAVMGNRTALVAARSTAAIVGLPLDASIVLLNRENEWSPVGQGGGLVQGKNLFVSGSGGVTVPGGIRLAANKALSGEIGSNGSVTASYTWTMATQGTTNWTPTTQRPDSGSRFQDPFGGLGVGGGSAQPPLTTQVQPDCPVPTSGGVATIQGSSDANAPLLLAPGNYYGTDNSGNPTWAPVQIKGYVRFTGAASATASPVFTYAGKTTAACKVGVAGNGSNFGNYFIYGGLQSSGGPTVTVEPGRYVLAGVHYSGGGGQAQDVLQVTSNMSLLDVNPNPDPPSSPSTNGGELFVLTRPDYPGVNVQVQNIPKLANANPTQNLDFGSTNIQAGTQTLALQLHGLTPGLGTTDPLKPFEQVLFWQDQRNSNVAYNNDGTINVSAQFGCNPSAGALAVSINNPCTNTLSHADSPLFNYQGGANTTVSGVFYQPRGAWMKLQGGGNSTASSMRTLIVSGSLQVAGSSTINFGPLATPPIERVVALVD